MFEKKITKKKIKLLNGRKLNEKIVNYQLRKNSKNSFNYQKFYFQRNHIKHILQKKIYQKLFNFLNLLKIENKMN